MTGRVIALVILGLVVLLVFFAGARLVWALFRGDDQIEGTSWGRQYLGRTREPNGDSK